MRVEDRQPVSSLARWSLWWSLIAISAILVMWPVVLSPNDPLPMQSVHAIRNIPLFIAVLCGWTGVFGTLLLRVKGNTWDRLSLCLIFSAVFVQFWGPVTNPWGNSGDSAWLLGHVRLLLETGNIPTGGHPALTYFDFPGIQLALLSLNLVTGVELFQVSRIYLAASSFILVVITYAAFLKLMRSPHYAAMALVLALASSRVLSVVTNQFHPINLATIYIAVFVLLMAIICNEQFGDRRTVFAATILVMAATMEYLFTPTLFSAVLFAAYLLRAVAKSFGKTALAIAVFSLAASTSWEVYQTVHSFPTTVSELPIGLRDLINGAWLIPTSRVLAANLGPSYPWWGTLAKLFWWCSTFVLGTLLVVRRFFGGGGTDNLGRMEPALFAGILATVSVGSLVGGAIGVIHGGLSRYVWVAPLVLAPAVTRFFIGTPARKFAIAFALAALFMLPPTFMTNGDILSTNRTYRSEVAALEFLKAQSKSEKSLTLYSLPSMPGIVLLYIPDAHFRTGAYLYGGTSEADAWNTLRRLARDFRANDSRGARLALVSLRGRKDYELRLGISPNHPGWANLTQELSRTSRIYDAETMVLYFNQLEPGRSLE